MIYLPVVEFHNDNLKVCNVRLLSSLPEKHVPNWSLAIVKVFPFFFPSYHWAQIMYVYTCSFSHDFLSGAWPKTFHVLIIFYNCKTQEIAEPSWKLCQQLRSLKLIKFPSTFWKLIVRSVQWRICSLFVFLVVIQPVVRSESFEWKSKINHCGDWPHTYLRILSR